MKQISINDIPRYCPSQKSVPILRPEVEKDWDLEKRNLKGIKSILADQFVIKDIEKDLKEGIDFLILITNSGKIGVRLRRNVFYLWKPTKMISTITERKYKAYPREEFTIRYSRPSGVATELHKILAGYIDYFLYGFVNQIENEIIQWFLGDLDIFRTFNPQPIDRRLNNPPDSKLNIYKLKSLPETFISASSNLP